MAKKCGPTKIILLFINRTKLIFNIHYANPNPVHLVCQYLNIPGMFSRLIDFLGDDCTWSLDIVEVYHIINLYKADLTKCTVLLKDGGWFHL